MGTCLSALTNPLTGTETAVISSLRLGDPGPCAPCPGRQHLAAPTCSLQSACRTWIIVLVFLIHPPALFSILEASQIVLFL